MSHELLASFPRDTFTKQLSNNNDNNNNNSNDVHYYGDINVVYKSHEIYPRCLVVLTDALAVLSDDDGRTALCAVLPAHRIVSAAVGVGGVVCVACSFPTEHLVFTLKDGECRALVRVLRRVAGVGFRCYGEVSEDADIWGVDLVLPSLQSHNNYPNSLNSLEQIPSLMLQKILVEVMKQESDEKDRNNNNALSSSRSSSVESAVSIDTTLLTQTQRVAHKKQKAAAAPQVPDESSLTAGLSVLSHPTCPYKERVAAFWQFYHRKTTMTETPPAVVAMLREYAGREEVLIRKLESEVGPEPDKERWLLDNALYDERQRSQRLQAKLTMLQSEVYALTHDPCRVARSLEDVLTRAQNNILRRTGSKSESVQERAGSSPHQKKSEAATAVYKMHLTFPTLGIETVFPVSTSDLWFSLLALEEDSATTTTVSNNGVRVRVSLPRRHHHTNHISNSSDSDVELASFTCSCAADTVLHRLLAETKDAAVAPHLVWVKSTVHHHRHVYSLLPSVADGWVTHTAEAFWGYLVGQAQATQDERW
eukprot:PhM_4_TR15080/c0_g1_i1/m.6597